MSRNNLTACENEEDFFRKVNYTSGLSETDYPNLKCIPADNFTLYNDPGKNLANSIGLLFEQCGGKNSEELPEFDPSADSADSFADSIDAIASEVTQSFQVLENLQCSLTSSLGGGALDSGETCPELEDT